ncbi:MAG: hypothetical protein GY938_29180, partial [Ketobacter sp.]|nr:hypothetical protein [Ketobacter sp.]
GGADASTPNITGNTYGGHGAGGDGGAGILILPSGAAAVNFSDYINASNGVANLSGAKAEKAHYHESGSPYDVRSFYDPPSPVNRAISSTVVTYFPRQSDPQSEKQRNIDAPWEDSINSLRDETEERFANTQRNKYDVFFTTHAPTGAVAYDYWAQIDNLDDDDRPIGLILLDSVWELVGRTNKEYEVQIDSYMSLTGAQRAQATADGKITT